MNSRIPTIDISPLYTDDLEAKLEVAKQIDLICRKSGFFQINLIRLNNAYFLL